MQTLVARVPPRAWNAFLWLAPIAFALWLYWDGLQCWFFQDDFAWLGLIRQVHNPQDLLRALFVPAAQGTIRPWSERAFFLIFESLFGYDSLPFRITVFLTVAADLLLIAWIMRRITRSAVAGALAGVVWMANASLTTVMTWNSAFNEALCPCFLLTALALFIRYIETGRRAWWWLQVVVFLLGFGALEINIVYPALAAAWVLFIATRERRRSLIFGLLPLFAISAGYFLIHRSLAPLPRTGPYALRFNSRILTTLGLYTQWLLVPETYANLGHAVFGRIVLIVCGVSILFFAFREFQKRSRIALFFLAWFLITLGPILPLPEHRTDYYLTMPAIALGMMVAYAMTRLHPALVAIPLLAYLTVMIPTARLGAHWARARSEDVRGMVEGIAAARQAHPGKLLVLQGVTTELFNDAIAHSPFYPLNIENVYLVPGSETNIQAAPGNATLSSVVLEPALLTPALRRGDAVIYSIAGDHLRNVTDAYRRSAPDLKIRDNDVPDRIDAGDPLYSGFLGPEWLPLESGFRWMPGKATFRIHGPGVNGGHIVLDGFCPKEQLQQAPRRVRVIVDGIPAGETKIIDPETTFHRLIALPAVLNGRASMNVEIDVDPVLRRDGNEYGLVFGRIVVGP